MAVNQNGDLPLQLNSSSLQTSVTSLDSVKQDKPEVHSLTTARRSIQSTSYIAGDYTVITNTGTGSLYYYNDSNTLVQQIDVTSTAAAVTVAAGATKVYAVGSTTNTITITKAPTANSTSPASITLITATSSGNFNATSGGSLGNYTTGDLAHVVVVGGGGGGSNSLSWGGGNPGGTGGINFNNTQITLSGNYAVTVGALGNAGGPSPSFVAGGNGGPSSALGLTANGGNGGGTNTSPKTPGNNGGPTVWGSTTHNTNVFRPVNNSTIGASGWGFNGNGGSPSGGPVYTGGNAGGSGGVYILRWTP